MANSDDNSEPDLPINIKVRPPRDYPDSWTVLWVWLHLTQNFPPLYPPSLPSCLVGWELQAVSPLDFLAVWKEMKAPKGSVSTPCVCSYLSVCAQVCMYVRVHKVPLTLFPGCNPVLLVVNRVLILPEIRPEMWLPCERFSWGQFWKEQIQQELLTGHQSSAIS